jgi:molybdopterin-guanine dinucleotide biosynthesis protein A
MKATKPKLFGLILAGGYSKRMGQDKALLEFHGKPQIEFLFDLLQSHCDKVFLSKRRGQKAYKNFDCIDDADEFLDQGPLGGILSAMKEYPGADWLVVACDLPFITDETLQTLLTHRNLSKTATAFISTHDSLPEPLCAVWQGHAYQPVLKLFYEGIHCPRKALMKSNACLLKQNDPRWLDNINTPEQAASVIARREAPKQS